MDNGMATESIWGDFLPLVYGREATEDRDKTLRITTNGAMDEFPTPDDLLLKAAGIIDFSIERQCSRIEPRSVKQDH